MNDKQTLLKEWIDNELDTEQAAELSRQVEQDNELAQEVAFLKALGTEIRGLENQSQVRGAEAALAKIRTPKGSWFKLHIAGLVATSVLSLFVVVPMLTSGGEAATADTGGSTASASLQEAAKYQAPALSRPPLAEERKSMVADKEMEIDGRVAARSRMSPTYRADSREILEQSRSQGASTSGMTTSEAHQYMRPQLIRSAQMAVGVKDALRSREDLQQLVESWGGFVISSNVRTAEATTVAELEVRVPEFSFEKALVAIRGMGKLMSENSSGQDVTAEVVDKRTRVEVLADEESVLVKRLGQTRDAYRQEVIRAQLRQVRMELASYKAQSKALEEQTKFSTITVSLQQGGKAGWQSESWSDDAYGEATGTLGSIAKVAGRVGIYALVLAPVWLPLVAVGYLLWRRSRP